MTEIPHQIYSETNFNYHIEEFKQLKDEVLQNQRTKLQIEIFSISATGLLASFFVTNKSLIEQSSAELIWWSPLLVLYFGLIWSRSFTQRNLDIGEYLSRVENRFGLSDLGWEKTIHPIKVARGGRLSYPKRILWIGLFFYFGLLAAKFGSAPIWRLFTTP